MSIRRAYPYLIISILVLIPLSLVLWHPLRGWSAKQLFCLSVKESIGAELTWESCHIDGSTMKLVKPTLYWEEKPVFKNPSSTFWWNFLFSSLSVEVEEGLIELYHPTNPIHFQGLINLKKGDLIFLAKDSTLTVSWDRHEPLHITAESWPVETFLSFAPEPIESLKGSINGTLSWHHQNPSPLNVDALEIVCPEYKLEIPSMIAEIEILKEHHICTSYSASPCQLKTQYGNLTFMGFSTSFHRLSNKHQVIEWDTVLMPDEWFTKPIPILGSITKRAFRPTKGEIIFKGDELVGSIHLNETNTYSLILSPHGTPPFSLEGEHGHRGIEGSLTLHEKSCKVHYAFNPKTFKGKLSANRIPLYQFDHYFNFPIDLDEMEATLSFSGEIDKKSLEIEYLVEEPKLTNDYISIFFSAPLRGVYELSFPNLLQRTEIYFKEGFLFDQESHLTFQQLSGTLCMDDFGIYFKNTKGECRGFAFLIDSKYEEGLLTVYPRSLSGTVSDLQKVIKPLRFPDWITSLPIEAFIIGKGDEKGWVRDTHGVWSGELSGEIFDGFTTKKLHNYQIDSLSCDYRWNFGEHDFIVEHLHAKIKNPKGDEYTLFAAPLSLAHSEKSPIYFDFWVTDEKEDLIRVGGHWKTSPDTSTLQFSLNPELTHLGTISPTACSFTLRRWEELLSGNCTFDISSSLLKKEIERFSCHTSAPLMEWVTSPLHNMKPNGSVHVEVAYQSDQELLTALIQGKGLLREDNSPFPLKFDGTKRGSTWQIEECSLDTLSFSGEVVEHNFGYTIEFLGLEYDSWIVCGCQGSYDKNKKILELNAPLTLIDTAVVGQLYSLPFNGNWRGKANTLISLDPFNISIQGSGQLEDFSLGPFEVSQRTPIHFELSSIHHGVELETTLAKILLQFDKGICRHINGEGEGFSLRAENMNHEWRGELDCNLSAVFPSHKGQLHLTGSLNPAEFEGKVEIRQFQAFQGLLDQVEAQVHYENGAWSIHNLQMTDQEVQLFIPHLSCKMMDKDWQIFIPKLTGRELYPKEFLGRFFGKSFAHPLKIESFTLYDLISHYPYERWEGSGTLQFCHLFSLDETPNIHIPKEQLNTVLSVDPKWLIPTSGEVDFSFSEDLIFVEKFKDFYSEGKGIRFELTPGEKPAQIAWDGTWYLPLKLKPHNLPMKWVEMVTLTLSGNFQDPHLHWNGRK